MAILMLVSCVVFMITRISKTTIMTRYRCFSQPNLRHSSSPALNEVDWLSETSNNRSLCAITRLTSYYCFYFRLRDYFCQTFKVLKLLISSCLSILCQGERNSSFVWPVIHCFPCLFIPPVLCFQSILRATVMRATNTVFVAECLFLLATHDHSRII